MKNEYSLNTFFSLDFTNGVHERSPPAMIHHYDTNTNGTPFVFLVRLEYPWYPYVAIPFTTPANVLTGRFTLKLACRNWHA